MGIATTVIVDNGAATIKAGLAASMGSPRLVTNAIVRGKGDRRNYIGDQLDQCTDFSSLYYRLPFEKGFLTGWGVEQPIWDRLFSQVLKIEPEETRLVMTEPCFNLPSIQETYDQMLFEEYGFAALYRTTAPQLCMYNDIGGLFGDGPGPTPDCVLLVDSGYSFTHIIPFVKGAPILSCIKRINVGGKLLTNQLKETVSFRYYDMMEETYIINDIKETCCYVSQDVMKDLDICRKPYEQNAIIQEYVLPDFATTKRGHVRPKQTSQAGSLTNIPSDQILTMNNERFMIPEILMRPSDIGMPQAGIPEAIVQSIDGCDEDCQGLLYANIVLVGGNAQFQGFQERIEHELRQLAPSEYDIRIATPTDPTTFAWHGGNQFVLRQSKAEAKRLFVTRQEYLEYGSDICYNKFHT